MYDQVRGTTLYEVQPNWKNTNWLVQVRPITKLVPVRLRTRYDYFQKYEIAPVRRRTGTRSYLETWTECSNSGSDGRDPDIVLHWLRVQTSLNRTIVVHLDRIERVLLMWRDLDLILIRSKIREGIDPVLCRPKRIKQLPSRSCTSYEVVLLTP